MRHNLSFDQQSKHEGSHERQTKQTCSAGVVVLAADTDQEAIEWVNAINRDLGVAVAEPAVPRVPAAPAEAVPPPPAATAEQTEMSPEEFWDANFRGLDEVPWDQLVSSLSSAIGVDLRAETWYQYVYCIANIAAEASLSNTAALHANKGMRDHR